MRRVLGLVVLLALFPTIGWAQQNNSLFVFDPTGASKWVAPLNAPFEFRGQFHVADPNGASSLAIYNVGGPGQTNYEVGKLYWTGNVFVIQTTAGGTGSFRGIQIVPGGGSFIVPTILATADDTYNLGVATSNRYMGAYFTRWIQGSKSKALTGGSATTFLRVAVPQTAAANYGGGSVGYTVYATDGTDSQSLVGKLYFAMVNKAGTEACSIGEVGTPVLAQSSGSTLTCTFTCATASADTVDIAANCASGLTETTFTIEYRGDMQKPNTWTPQ